jgi:hypothetical protein
MMGDVSTTIVSTLKSVAGSGDKQQATIATRQTAKQKAAAAQPNPMGLTFKMGESTGEGEVVFEVGTGRLQRSITRSTIPLVMSGSGPDGSPMNMTTIVKSTVTAERVQ